MSEARTASFSGGKVVHEPAPQMSVIEARIEALFNVVHDLQRRVAILENVVRKEP